MIESSYIQLKSTEINHKRQQMSGRPYQLAFAWRNKMGRQFVRKVETIQLEADKIHGQCKLIRVELSVLVDIRQFPDFTKNRVRQPRLDEFRLGVCTGDLAVDRPETVEDFVVLVALPCNDPFLVMVASFVDALPFANAEWTLEVAFECTALNIFQLSHALTSSNSKVRLESVNFTNCDFDLVLENCSCRIKSS